MESEREYDGYYYSLGEALSIVVLGSLCGLKNVHPDTPMGGKREDTRMVEIRN